MNNDDPVLMTPWLSPPTAPSFSHRGLEKCNEAPGYGSQSQNKQIGGGT